MHSRSASPPSPSVPSSPQSPTSQRATLKKQSNPRLTMTRKFPRLSPQLADLTVEAVAQAALAQLQPLLNAQNAELTRTQNELTSLRQTHETAVAAYKTMAERYSRSAEAFNLMKAQCQTLSSEVAQLRTALQSSVKQLRAASPDSATG